MISKLINNNAQEEMTGFAMIIIIVSIVGLVILTFMLRKSSDSGFNNYEIQQFLDSTARIKSTCKLPLGSSNLRISDLIQECYSSSANACESGEQTCASLQSAYQDIIGKSWNINPDSQYTGFKIDIFFKPSSNSSSISPSNMLNISQGVCGSNYYGGESFLPEKERTGTFITRMELCLGNSTAQ